MMANVAVHLILRPWPGQIENHTTTEFSSFAMDCIVGGEKNIPVT